MTISQTQFFSELASGHLGPPIPEPKRVYFQTRLRNRMFNFILNKFVEESKNGLTKAILARRVGKTPDVINRMLGAPSNLTLDTISDLLLGITAEELKLISESPINQAPTNYLHSEWISQDNQSLHVQPTSSNPVPLGLVVQQNEQPTIPRQLLGR